MRSSATSRRRWPSPRRAPIPTPTTCWSTCSPSKVVRAAGRRGAAVRAAGPTGGWGPQARGERHKWPRPPRRAYKRDARVVGGTQEVKEARRLKIIRGAKRLRARLALQQVFQRLQVVFDRRLVLSELPVGHPRLTDQRKHELAALSVGHDPHGIVDADARLELDVMIHDAERVPLHESHPDLAERGVRDPLIAVPPDLGARQPCGPAWQVPRVGGELVDLGRPASDENADMLNVVHGTTSLGRAGSDAKSENVKHVVIRDRLVNGSSAASTARGEQP